MKQFFLLQIISYIRKNELKTEKQILKHIEHK